MEDSEVIQSELSHTRGNAWSLAPCSQPSFSIGPTWYTRVNDIWVFNPHLQNFIGQGIYSGTGVLLELIIMKMIFGWILRRGFWMMFLWPLCLVLIQRRSLLTR